MESDTQSIASRAEAFLFVEGGPIARTKLARLLTCKDAELESALMALSTRLRGSGLALITTDQEISLAIAPQESAIIAKEMKLELEREIGDAGLEVLAILMYRGPSTRAQIDYIRGVNTSTTLRTLLTRGLVMRRGNPNDTREYLYSPTTELLAHLGVSAKTELPDYATIAGELAAFEASQENIEKEHAPE